MRIVTPFRPFEAESIEHKNIGPFDWVGAIDMLRASAERACGCPVVAITDEDTNLPPTAFKYATTNRRLMPWIVEVCLRYIESEDFDQDTIMLSPDTLVFGGLAHYFARHDFDLAVVARHHEQRPMLNGFQLWPVASRDRLRNLYRAVYARALEQPEAQLVWGGDTTPFVELFGPAVPGRLHNAGAGWVHWLDANSVFLTFADPMMHRPPPADRLVDFRYRRKLYMRAYFEQKFAPLIERHGWVFAAGDKFMAGEIDERGGYQASHLHTAAAMCRQRRVAVDGGAHVGTWSIPLARLFNRVMAFEPSGDSYEALLVNVERHKASNVKCRQQALGKTNGRVDMTLDGMDKAQATGNLGARYVIPGSMVRVVPLDGFALEDLDFLKLDVEGSEVDALMGARETLLRCKPVVLFEDKHLWERYGYSRRAPHEILAGLGAQPIQRVAMDEIWGWR